MSPPSDRPIYLDYNATTPVLDEVREAMLPYLGERFGNPSSSHRYGREARRGVDRARRQVAELIGASPKEIVFTSGGTESNNLALRGAAQAISAPSTLITTTIEHSAVQRPCDCLGDRGWEIVRIGVDRHGSIDVDAAAGAIGEETSLVSVMHSNNEVGTIQPVAAVADMAHSARALVHTDAAQSVGKVEIDVGELGVDLLTIAGHKLYAPKGIGALYVRDGVNIEPLLCGAGHENGRRPGTENVACIVGLGKACVVAANTVETERQRLESLRDQLWERLRNAIPDLALNGHPERRLPNTLNIRFPGADSSELLAMVPELAASTGSACKEGGHAPSPVLMEMGLSKEQALASLRLSLGRKTTDDDVRQAADLLIDAWQNRGHTTTSRR